MLCYQISIGIKQPRWLKELSQFDPAIENWFHSNGWIHQWALEQCNDPGVSYPKIKCKGDRIWIVKEE